MKQKKRNLKESQQNNDDFRDSLQTLIDKSEVEFEKKLTLLSSGGLGISVALVDKVVPIQGAVVTTSLFFGWSFLLLTLAVNLISQLISKGHIFQTIEEYDNGETGISYKVKKRNKIIDGINWFCALSFILGVVLILFFIIFNLNEKK